MSPAEVRVVLAASWSALRWSVAFAAGRWLLAPVTALALLVLVLAPERTAERFAAPALGRLPAALQASISRSTRLAVTLPNQDRPSSRGADLDIEFVFASVAAFVPSGSTEKGVRLQPGV
jgi:hypothetical protein